MNLPYRSYYIQREIAKIFGQYAYTTISMEPTPTHGLCLLQSLWKQPQLMDCIYYNLYGNNPQLMDCVYYNIYGNNPQLMDCVYNNLNGNNPNSISLTVQLTEWAQPVDHLLILKCPTNKYLRHSQSRQPIGMQTNYKKWRKVPKLYLQTISPVT